MVKGQSAAYAAAGQNIASAVSAAAAGAPAGTAPVRPGAITRAAATPTRSASPVPPATPAPAPAASAAPMPGATPAQSQTWQANLARLEGLAEVLSHHGLRARLMTPPGRVPSLHVVNPCATALAEDVYAGRGQDGLWWFWWSWAERITVGEDLEGAASRIEHVLASSS